MGYQSLRDYLRRLEDDGELIRVEQKINKDTELMPLVRWQFRGLAKEQRKAFWFDNVVDAKGRKYDMPVVVGILGASRKIYALAMGTTVDQISRVWERAQLHPVDPVVVPTGSVKEVMHREADLLKEGGGMDLFPTPISLPGFDPAPYLSAPCMVSKDPDTGIRNVGTYRGMVKARNRLGILAHRTQHLGVHMAKCKRRGKPLEVAIILGYPPQVGLCSVTKIPYGIDEFTIAGGITGEPIPLVKCETIDVEVPAEAEIVLEGVIPTDYLEPEAPFGEFTGYMGERILSPVFHIQCITHRRKPIYHAYISQFPPSESSTIRGIGREAVLYKHLKHNCNVPGILDVACHDYCGSNNYVVIQMDKIHNSHAWQALNSAVGYDAGLGKIIVAVDKDIDPHDAESVNWALCYRMQPHLDMRVAPGKVYALDPSSAPPGASREERHYPSPTGTSCVLFDATRKWAYPPVSLPEKPYMENARAIWREMGLPALTPRVPWYGYSLGDWTEENEEEARMAVRGEYYQTGEKLAQRGVKV